jgi:hypothetical protein
MNKVTNKVTNIFLRIHEFFNNLKPTTKTTTSVSIFIPLKNNDVIPNNKIYEDDDLLVHDFHSDADADADVDSDVETEFGLKKKQPCCCKICYFMKNICKFQTYKCNNERKHL